MHYFNLLKKRKIPWLIMGIFALAGTLLLFSLVLFVLGCSCTYSSFGYRITSYTPPSHGYLSSEKSNLVLSNDIPSLSRASWSGSLHERQLLAWPMVRHLSKREDLEPALVMALVQVESRFKPDVVSHRGAKGLMQINSHTARHLGLEDPTDPEANLEAGIRYLSSLGKMFDYDIRLMLAAYNAGPARVLAAGSVVPPIKETQEFVEKVLAQREEFRSRFQ